jgi:signal recognition particle subunit SRP54
MGGLPPGGIPGNLPGLGGSGGMGGFPGGMPGLGGPKKFKK